MHTDRDDKFNQIIQFDLSKIKPYLVAIKQLPKGRELTRNELIVSEFRLHIDSDCEIYYVPFDYYKPKARLLIAGITPGWTQMELAYRTLVAALADGKNWQESYTMVERSASFAGSMRKNLVSMLDDLNVHHHLSLASSNNLFEDAHHLVNTTSVIRYAVFVRGKNYRGDTPNMLKHPKLLEYVETEFFEEVQQVPEALIIPQGKAVQAVLEYLIDIGKLEKQRCLLNFPHASGANGHRKKFFEAAKDEMARQVTNWLVR
jgi:hypothetical protein